MMSLRRPSAAMVRGLLAAQAKLNFAYPAVGATAGTCPAGYVMDHTRIRLGEGEEVDTRAKHALLRWEQFGLGWVMAWPSETAIRPGEVEAVVDRRYGVWWPIACRIVDVVDEAGLISRFGFVYGTLPDHAGTWEERFLVEWQRASGAVWYDILAFSRPNKLLTWLGSWSMRRLQQRFGSESGVAMARAVQDRGERPMQVSGE